MRAIFQCVLTQSVLCKLIWIILLFDVTSTQETCRQNRILSNEFRLLCDNNGYFMTKQCDFTINQCWCVNRVSGLEVNRSRDQRRGYNIDCDNFPFTRCERQRRLDPRVNCDTEGLYPTTQCNKTHCKCINVVNGKFIPGRIHSINSTFNCSDQRSRCQIHRDSMKHDLHVGAKGLRKPVICGVDGYYLRAQCDSSDYRCNCVDRDTGEVVGKRYHVIMFDFLCDDTTDGTEKQMDCEWRKHQILQQYLPLHPIPQCTPNGTFMSKQCDEGRCWCVNEYVGTLIRGTRARKKKFAIDCDNLPAQKCFVEKLENGEVILPKGGFARPGTSVSYKCKPGYKLSRPFYNRCLPPLVFSKIPPTCIKLEEERDKKE